MLASHAENRRVTCLSIQCGANRHIESAGGRTRTRTLDPLIKSQLLYQLSYAPQPKNPRSGTSTIRRFAAMRRGRTRKPPKGGFRGLDIAAMGPVGKAAV